MSDAPSFRPYEEPDRAWFIALFTDPEVMAHVDGALSAEAAASLFDLLLRASRAPGSQAGRVYAAWVVETEGGHAHAALLRHESDLEIGYILPVAAWGRGLATRIARELVRRALATAGDRRIVATVDPDHVASRRVLEKAGLQHAERIEDELGAYDLYVLAGQGEAGRRR